MGVGFVAVIVDREVSFSVVAVVAVRQVVDVIRIVLVDDAFATLAGRVVRGVFN